MKAILYTIVYCIFYFYVSLFLIEAIYEWYKTIKRWVKKINFKTE